MCCGDCIHPAPRDVGLCGTDNGFYHGGGVRQVLASRWQRIRSCRLDASAPLLQIFQPPGVPLRLELGEPSAAEVEHDDGDSPDQIEQRKTPDIAFGRFGIAHRMVREKPRAEEDCRSRPTGRNAGINSDVVDGHQDHHRAADEIDGGDPRLWCSGDSLRINPKG